MEKSFIKNLNWRFATKIFDPEKKVSDGDLEKILEAIRYSPSSFGLQPFHVHVITDSELRMNMKTYAWNQSQVTDASHFLVFSSRTDVMERVEQLMELLTSGNPEIRSKMKAYESMMIGFAENRDPKWIKGWGERQAYIALGFAMAACAELEIDSCPMEGFDAEAFDKLLHPPEHMKSVVALAIGYRKEGPAQSKTRFPSSDLFTRT
jgi:nitroreductase